MQPISAQEKLTLGLSLHWRIPLTMATDEADAALDHERNNLTGLLRTGEEELLPIEEHETGDRCGNQTHLVRRISAHTSAHASVHTCMCAGRGWAGYPAVARRQRFFPLFVLGFPEISGR